MHLSKKLVREGDASASEGSAERSSPYRDATFARQSRTLPCSAFIHRLIRSEVQLPPERIRSFRIWLLRDLDEIARLTKRYPVEFGTEDCIFVFESEQDALDLLEWFDWELERAA